MPLGFCNGLLSGGMDDDGRLVGGGQTDCGNRESRVVRPGGGSRLVGGSRPGGGCLPGGGSRGSRALRMWTGSFKPSTSIHGSAKASCSKYTSCPAGMRALLLPLPPLFALLIMKVNNNINNNGVSGIIMRGFLPDYWHNQPSLV